MNIWSQLQNIHTPPKPPKTARTNNRKPWSKEDNKIIVKNYNTMSLSELSDLLGRTEISVRTQAYKLGATVKRNFFTQKEIDFLIETDGTKSAQEQAKHLNRSVPSVYRKRRNLGLRIKTISDSIDKDLVVNMRKLGLTYYQISRALEVSEATIFSVIKEA